MLDEKVQDRMAGHPNRMTLRGRLRALSVASLAAVAILVTGCTNGDPDITPLPEPPASDATAASPTPTPTSGAYFAPEPTSEAQAIADATKAYEFFLATAAEIYASPSDSSGIDEIAKQGAANGVHDIAASLVEKDSVLDFNDSFELNTDDSYAIVMVYGDGTETPYGSAHLYGCLDASLRQGVTATGVPLTFPEQDRVVVHVTAAYYVDSGRWFVFSDVPEGDEEVIPC